MWLRDNKPASGFPFSVGLWLSQTAIRRPNMPSITVHWRTSASKSRARPGMHIRVHLPNARLVMHRMAVEDAARPARAGGNGRNPPESAYCSLAGPSVFSARFRKAALAQLVEQRIRNAWVGCSSHPGGTSTSVHRIGDAHAPQSAGIAAVPQQVLICLVRAACAGYRPAEDNRRGVVCSGEFSRSCWRPY